MLLNFLTLIIILFFLIELNHQLRIDSPIILKPIESNRNEADSKHRYVALIEISNIHRRMEVMIPFFKVYPQLIGISKDDLISINTRIKPIHPDVEEQNNDYWSAYILKGKKSTFVKIEVTYEIKNGAIDKLKCLWLDIEWGN